MSEPQLPLNSTQPPVTPANLALPLTQPQERKKEQRDLAKTFRHPCCVGGCARSLLLSLIFCSFSPCQLILTQTDSPLALNGEKKGMTKEASSCVYLSCSPTHNFTLLMFFLFSSSFFVD